jgi:hypothetical protein
MTEFGAKGVLAGALLRVVSWVLVGIAACSLGLMMLRWSGFHDSPSYTADAIAAVICLVFAWFFRRLAGQFDT